MKNLAELLDITSVSIAGEEYEFDTNDFLTVDNTNLQHEFTRHTKLVAIIGFAYEAALLHSQRQEIALDKIYALCDARERANAMAIGAKKPTETMIDNVVKTAQEYQEQQQITLQARSDLGKLKALKEAMQHRKDCLVGLGANYRSEINAEATLRQ